MPRTDFPTLSQYAEHLCELVKLMIWDDPLVKEGLKIYMTWRNEDIEDDGMLLSFCLPQMITNRGLYSLFKGAQEP